MTTNVVPIGTQLDRWQAGAKEANPDRGAELMRLADLAEMEAIRTRQAANRALIYTRRRPSRYAEAQYARLKPEQNPGNRISAWRAHGPRALVIAGPARTGKTFAAYAVANDTHGQNLWVTVWPAAELSAALKPDADANAYDHATTCDLLVLDDLGRERVTDWWLEQLQRIVDHRCAHELRLVVTTNSPANGPEAAYEDLVKRYGDPIVERLIDGGGIVVLDGPPQRHLVTEW
ncbi:ATP-binding protein [Micromonospora sp. NPDC049801]|uniref:ATP-binding protein n=1 Tax=unclassified Micromonospora TaxID=2617518 RepID=UPI0033C0771B